MIFCTSIGYTKNMLNMLRTSDNIVISSEHLSIRIFRKMSKSLEICVYLFVIIYFTTLINIRALRLMDYSDIPL